MRLIIVKHKKTLTDRVLRMPDNATLNKLRDENSGNTHSQPKLLITQ